MKHYLLAATIFAGMGNTAAAQDFFGANTAESPYIVIGQGLPTADPFIPVSQGGGGHLPTFIPVGTGGGGRLPIDIGPIGGWFPMPVPKPPEPGKP